MSSVLDYVPITPDRYLEPYFNLTETYYREYIDNHLGKDSTLDILFTINTALHLTPAVFISAWKAHTIDSMYFTAKSWKSGTAWFTDKQGYSWYKKASKSQRLLGRIGSKFLPGIGLISVAYDVYSVAKWADERWDIL